METDFLFWVLVAGFIITAIVFLINLFYGKEGFLEIGKFIEAFFLSLFKEKEISIFGSIEDPYIMDCGLSDLYCIEIRDLSRKKVYLVSMKHEHADFYHIFKKSKGDKTTHFNIVCTKRFFFENAEFVKLL
jgi:hypothetical protein